MDGEPEGKQLVELHEADRTEQLRTRAHVRVSSSVTLLREFSLETGTAGFGSEGAQPQASVGRSLCRHLRRVTSGLQPHEDRELPLWPTTASLRLSAGAGGKPRWLAREWLRWENGGLARKPWLWY